MPARHTPDDRSPREPTPAIKGRGAVGNVLHRFAQTRTEPVDDGWAPVHMARMPDAIGHGAHEDGEEAGEDDDAALWGPPVRWRTEVTEEWAKSAIARNRSPDVPFDQGLNPYRGCEHGCIYCYARPTHSYLGLSPGLDFERRIIAKVNIADRLAHEIDSPRYHPRPIVIGTVTDAYQPIERQMRLTRQVLEVLAARRHPFSIITKSAAVERDLDLIAPMAERGLASVCVTITSLDGELVRKLEPRAASPARRLRTIRTLAAAGVPVCVSVAPQIPFINEDMEQVLAAASEAGARQAFYTVLRLPWELGEVFQDWLHAHFPDRAARVMARMRDLRDGRINDALPGRRMRGQSLWADLLAQRFAHACRQLGLNQDADASPRAERASHPEPAAQARQADQAEPRARQTSLF